MPCKIQETLRYNSAELRGSAPPPAHPRTTSSEGPGQMFDLAFRAHDIQCSVDLRRRICFLFPLAKREEEEEEEDAQRTKNW